MTRAKVCLAAVAAAYCGQAFLVLDPPATSLMASLTPAQRFHGGWILLVLAAVAFVWAWWRTPEDVPWTSHTATEGASTPDTRSLLRLLPAVAVSGLNTWLVIQRGERPVNVWLWALSILLLIVLAWERQQGARSPKTRPDDPPGRIALPAAGIIALLAFILRFVDLGVLPLAFHGDMARMGLGGRALLEGRAPAFFSTGWANIPWIGFMPEALGLRLFGNDLFGLRMASVLAGTATVLGIYCLSSSLFGRRIGLLASAMAAIGHAEIHFSRVSAYIDPVPWMVFGLHFFMSGLRLGGRLSFALSGVFLTFGFLMYYAGRIGPVVGGAFVLYMLVVHRQALARRWRGLVILGMSAVVTLGPMAAYFWAQQEAFRGRMSGVYIFNPDTMRHLLGKYHATSTAEVLFEQTWRSLLVLNYSPDTSSQFGFPGSMLNPLLAPLAVLGLAMALCRWRSPGHVLVVLWLGLVLVLGSILTVDAPFWPRIVPLLPPAAMLCAIALDRVLIALEHLPLERVWTRWYLWAIPFLAWAGWTSWGAYTAKYRTHVEPAEWLGRVIAREPPSTRFCMARGPRSFSEDEVQFLAPGYDLLDFDVKEAEPLLSRCVQESRVWVLYLPEHKELLERLRRQRPGARDVVHDRPGGSLGFLLWYPPP